MLGLLNKQFHQNYYNIITKFFNIESKIHFREIDFDKPWWQVYGWTKWQNLFVLFVVLLENSFLTVLPLIIVLLIRNDNVINYLAVGFVGFVIAIISTFGYIFNVTRECMISKNITHSANSYFLTVDPIYHSTKNSGQIISKVERSSFAFIEFDIGLVLDILPNLFGVIIGSGTLFFYNFNLGLIGSFGSLLILSLGVYFRIFNNIVFRKKVIQVEDDAKSLTVESLSQMVYIRSTFATIEQLNNSDKINKTNASVWSTFWITSSITDMTLYFIQVIFALLVGYYISQLVKFNGFDLINGLAAITTYLGGTSRIVGFGSNIKRLIEAEYKIRDLFLFIRTFGKQTFPVE